MEKEDKESSKLWKIYRTIHQMLRDRGYSVDQSVIENPYKEFIKKYGDGYRIASRAVLSFDTQNKNNSTDKILVFFPEDTTIGIKLIKTYIERMTDESIGRSIMVCRGNVTPSAVKMISTVSPKIVIEQFSDSELMINITEHELVPQHILLTSDEAKEILSKLMLKESQLPRLLITDPVARYYGMNRGNIVKILRKSETSGRYVTYRLVV